jgi:hypothetical protein
MGPVTSLFPSHESGFAQDLKVLGNGGIGYSQMLGKGAHAKVMTQKESDDLEPVGITQYFKLLFDVFHNPSENV